MLSIPPLPLFLINRSRLVITNRNAAFDKAHFVYRRSTGNYGVGLAAVSLLRAQGAHGAVQVAGR